MYWLLKRCDPKLLSRQVTTSVFHYCTCTRRAVTQVWVYSWFAMPLMLSAINGNFIWFGSAAWQRPAACVCMRCLIHYVRRFGGSFPPHRVKTATSFFTTLAISFPVGSLGEEFGWRGVMAPYINTLLDRRFGISRSWKWTPLLQSLITGVIWAVCECGRSSYQQRIPTPPLSHFYSRCRCGTCPRFTSMDPTKASAISGSF